MAERYLATVLPGFEDVAAEEIGTAFPDGKVQETARGRVIFAVRQAAPPQVLALRTVDNLFLYVGDVPAGPHRADLPALASAAASLVPPSAPTVMESVRGALPHRPSVWVNGSRAGKQTYSRFEAAGAVLDALLRRFPEWRRGTETEHALEFRLDVEADRARLSLRLTAPDFRFRGDARRFSAAALRPPVAHALVRLSRPSPDDVFLDPFCGSGTIVAERAVYPAARMIGSDVSEEALVVARANLAEAPGVELEQWDARALPLDARSLTSVVSNLPFGRQILAPDELPALYLAFCRELQRLFAPGAEAVLLTDQVETLLRAVERTRLRAVRERTLSLRGTHPEVVRLTAE